AQHARQRALRIVLAQLAVTAAATLLFLLAGPEWALSAAVGGLISTAGSYYQVRIAFSPRAQGDAALAARALYLGEGVKIAVVVALFALALTWLELQFLATILTFIATLGVFFAALLWDARSG
ncbi:MAG TPA: ATP synthase subunit I, partial [Pseudohaliea sp.]|nr:ATP synthase subunit I [Pseudohaliea sp.]